jgi:hypothetical protein
MYQQEFLGLQLGDERLNKRCLKIVDRVSQKPGLSFPRAVQRWGELKALYRFFSNNKVNRDKIMEPHNKRTVERCLQEKVVLSIQDTTYLDYSHHPRKEGLGYTRDRLGGHGMLLHTVFAVSGESGLPLGILGQDVIVRQTKHPAMETYLQRLERNRESGKWIQGLRHSQAVATAETRVIQVCDREADIYVFIKEIKCLCQGFVIRCCRNRSTEDGYLYENIASGPVMGHTDIRIQRNGTRKARVAHVAINVCSVGVLPPKVMGHKGAVLPVNIVRVEELNPPENGKSLSWILLTSESIATEEDCLRIVEYYRTRWLIEDFHKGLKTGCKVEERQVSTRQQLENVIGIYAVIAYQMLLLRFLSSRNNLLPADIPLTECQQTILRSKYPKEYAESPEQWLRLIARMGGFIGRKSDGHPGWLTLMRGMHDLILIEQGLLLANKLVGKG